MELVNLDFCPPNITFRNIWTEHGLSQCFMDTVGSSAMVAFIFISGIIQLVMYRRYATRIRNDRLRRSHLYNFQLFLMFLLPMLAATRFGLRVFVYNSVQIYGYMILTTVFIILSYLFAICLIVKERCHQLPSVPTRGHGIVLLIFFTLAFIVQNFAIINMNREDWWFQLKTRKDMIEMTLFVMRYICTLFIFVLGIKAPGISSVASEDEDNLVGNSNDVSNIFLT